MQGGCEPPYLRVGRHRLRTTVGATFLSDSNLASSSTLDSDCLASRPRRLAVSSTGVVWAGADIEPRPAVLTLLRVSGLLRIFAAAFLPAHERDSLRSSVRIRGQRWAGADSNYQEPDKRSLALRVYQVLVITLAPFGRSSHCGYGHPKAERCHAPHRPAVGVMTPIWVPFSGRSIGALACGFHSAQNRS